MKIPIWLALIPLALPLAGCPSVPATPPPTPAAVLPGADRIYRHPGTQMAFPEKVGDFARVAITRYQPDESDVGIGYNLLDPARPVALTVFVYPAPMVASFGSPQNVIDEARAKLFLDHYNSVKQEISNAHPGARLVAESNFKLVQNDGTFAGLMASFEYPDLFAGVRQDLTSELYLFQRGFWLIKYRVTFPQQLKPLADPAIGRFLQDLPGQNSALANNRPGRVGKTAYA